MPRRHVGPIPKLAASPSKLSTMLDLNYERVILPAIRSGELRCYVVANNKHRVLIEDAIKFIRKHPELYPRKSP